MNHLLSMAVLGVGAYVGSVAPSLQKHPLRKIFMNRNFAHRGLFDNQQIYENSIPAFRDALTCGYGIELDVQMTNDGKIVVFHDSNLRRLCNVGRDLSKCTYAQLQEFKLGNSKETIPLLSTVLDLISGKAPLIIEIKSTQEVERTCLHIYDKLRFYRGPVCIESMNPLILNWFAKNAPQVMRGQLATKFEEDDCLSQVLSSTLSGMYFNFLSRPHFIAYDYRYYDNQSFRLCKALGAFTVAWTVPEADYSQISPLFDSVIFEGFRPPAKIR